MSSGLPAGPAQGAAASAPATPAGSAPKKTAQSKAKHAEPDRRRQAPSRASRAAASALARESANVKLPGGWGTVQVPSPERLAFYGGILTLGLFGVIDWPVALAMGIGHLLADSHRNKVLADFGQALEEA